MRLFRGRLDPGMRLFRGRLTQACVYFGVGWPSMRLFPGRMAGACVYFRRRISRRSMRLFPALLAGSHAATVLERGAGRGAGRTSRALIGSADHPYDDVVRDSRWLGPASLVQVSTPAALRAAVPAPTGRTGQRSACAKPSSRSCSVGSRRHWCRFRAPARCRSETGAPSSCCRWQHAFRDGVGTRCGCEGRGAVRPELT